LKPKKNRKGDRYFRPDDIKNLELIYHLLRVRKFTISGAKDYLKNKAKSLDTFVMVQRLEKLKLFLQEIKVHA
jgi:DNA-binding transcriptional MerR regulator